MCSRKPEVYWKGKERSCKWGNFVLRQLSWTTQQPCGSGKKFWRLQCFLCSWILAQSLDEPLFTFFKHLRIPYLLTTMSLMIQLREWIKVSELGVEVLELHLNWCFKKTSSHRRQSRKGARADERSAEGIRSNLDGLYRGHDEELEVTTVTISRWKLVPFVVPCCCDIPGVNACLVDARNVIHFAWIGCLAFREHFWNMECGNSQSMGGALWAGEDFRVLWIK